MTQFLDRERRGSVLVLRMNWPERHNALGETSQFEEFESVCRDVNADLETKVVVLTGRGASFCAGGNIKDMAGRTGLFAGGPHELAENYRNGIQRIPRALSGLEVPTIAAVNGHAIGAGCDLACLCDVRIASEQATFAESFVALGIVSGIGGGWLLPRAVGWSRAAELTFTGETLAATEALACGLVSRVVAPDDLMPAALDLAGRIARHPAPALRLNKRLLRAGQHLPFDDLLNLAASYQAQAHHTEDHAAIMQRLRERTKAPKPGSTS
jgi:enoyl-CoA hydratase/carnithine racemase